MNEVNQLDIYIQALSNEIGELKSNNIYKEILIIELRKEVERLQVENKNLLDLVAIKQKPVVVDTNEIDNDKIEE